MMLISCREARQCLHQIPGCICDGDPTMAEPDIIEELDRIRSACTQKTFLHSPDWREGHKIIQAAIVEIKKLRAEWDQAVSLVEGARKQGMAAAFEEVAQYLQVQGLDTYALHIRRRGQSLTSTVRAPE
jgi:hypothetical protein